MLQYAALDGGLIGLTNAAAATAYYAVVPGRTGFYARISGLNYTAGNTANSFYLMRPIARAKTTAAYGTNVAAMVLDRDPSPTGNTIAANDKVVVTHTDGTYRDYVVNTSGWAANTNTVTFTANLAAAVASGAWVYNYGIFSDTDPVTGKAHPRLPTAANTTATIAFANAGGFRGAQKGDPLMVYNPNATNATDLNFAEYAHTLE